MRPIRANYRTSRYAQGILSSGMFTPEQTLYLETELAKISASLANVDEGFYPRWDDLKFPFTQTKRGSNLKPDFDDTNVGLLFPQNDPAEIVYMIGQFPHSYLSGSNVRPHIHWKQTGASFPVWTMEYMWSSPGDATPSSFTTLTTNTGAFPYVSGNLEQISSFAEIDGTGMKRSSIMLIKFYRDDNVVSGDVLGYEFDIHFQKHRHGTLTEYV